MSVGCLAVLDKVVTVVYKMQGDKWWAEYDPKAVRDSLSSISMPLTTTVSPSLAK
jgi:hypothetical protein